MAPPPLGLILRSCALLVMVVHHWKDFRPALIVVELRPTNLVALKCSPIDRYRLWRPLKVLIPPSLGAQCRITGISDCVIQSSKRVLPDDHHFSTESL